MLATYRTYAQVTPCIGFNTYLDLMCKFSFNSGLYQTFGIRSKRHTLRLIGHRVYGQLKTHEFQRTKFWTT